MRKQVVLGLAVIGLAVGLVMAGAPKAAFATAPAAGKDVPVATVNGPASAGKPGLPNIAIAGGGVVAYIDQSATLHVFGSGFVPGTAVTFAVYQSNGRGAPTPLFPAGAYLGVGMDGSFSGTYSLSGMCISGAVEAQVQGVFYQAGYDPC